VTLPFNTSSRKAEVGGADPRLDISSVSERSSPLLSRVPSRSHSMIRISMPKTFGRRTRERRPLKMLEFRRFATVRDGWERIVTVRGGWILTVRGGWNVMAGILEQNIPTPSVRDLKSLTILSLNGGSGRSTGRVIESHITSFIGPVELPRLAAEGLSPRLVQPLQDLPFPGVFFTTESECSKSRRRSLPSG
jgi:hypothetical protein